MLTTNVSKIKKSVLVNITFILNVYSDFKMKYNVNFKRILRLHTRAQIFINISCHKCLLYGTTHLYNYAVTEKLQHFKIKNS